MASAGVNAISARQLLRAATWTLLDAPIVVGNCSEIMAHMPQASVDAIITDLAATDHVDRGWVGEALRVLKPGSHLLAFGGTRLYHRFACHLEDEGFEIRDSLSWLHSHSGHEQSEPANRNNREDLRFAPAWEPIIMARKPLAGTVASNVLTHGTGALNVDGCRIEGTVPQTTHGVSSRRGEIHGHFRDEPEPSTVNAAGRWPANVALSHAAGCVRVGERKVRAGMAGPNSNAQGFRSRFVGGDTGSGGSYPGGYADADGTETIAKWDCVPNCPVALIDGQSGDVGSGWKSNYAERYAAEGRQYRGGGFGGGGYRAGTQSDTGGASRFFYTATANIAEADAGPTDMLPCVIRGGVDTLEHPTPPGGTQPCQRNDPPTVRPIDLVRWLVRLVTPPSGLVLDPFAGFGTTGAAAALEGFQFVGIERDQDHARTAEARIAFSSEESADVGMAQAIHVRQGDAAPQRPEQASLFDRAA